MLKLIVFDADNVLWNGTVFYDNVILKESTVETLKQIYKKGISIVLCSKNDETDVKKYLQQFKIDKYFEKLYIGWKPKGLVLQDILSDYKELQPQEVMLVDDEEFNREEVKRMCNVLTFYSDDNFDIIKQLDKKRYNLMLEQRERERTEKNWSGSRKEFLNYVNQKLIIKKAKEENIPRISILMNRTNELNAVMRRYSEEEVMNLFTDSTFDIYVAFLTDKFGDYGLIAEVIIQKNIENWVIFDIAVSCRTMGRGVAGNLIKHIIDNANNNSVPKLVGFVEPTKSNWRMTGLFEKFNFKKIKETNNKIIYELMLNE